MLCHLKSNHPQVIQRVESLRDEVIERAKSGEADVVFDSVMLHAVMQTYCRHGNPQVAEDLLDQLCQEVLEGTNEQNWELSSRR